MPKPFRDIVLLILVDREGRILLQHRTSDAWAHPDCWGFFGGGLEGNETPVVALQREIIEEIEYTLSNPRLVLAAKYDGVKTQGTRYVFLEKYDHHQKIILNEGQGFAWVSLSDLSGLKLSPHVQIILESAKDQLAGI